ncbi:MAG: hypothetical protein JWM10_3019 [Myxococcaceae bacterium]|nr:hypothetical protein [Myxococcaceae bacterium]
MALTAEQQRKCFLYTGHLQVNRTGVFVGGQPETTEATHILQTSLDNLTPNGETTVVAQLVILDALYAKLVTVDTRFQASKVGTIELNAKEWADRQTQWNFFRRQLAVTLDVQLDPVTAADTGGAGGSGPWREP